MCVYKYRKDIPGRFMQQEFGDIRVDLLSHNARAPTLPSHAGKAMGQDCCKEHHMPSGLNGTGYSCQTMRLLF